MKIILSAILLSMCSLLAAQDFTVIKELLNEDKINNPPQGWYINDISGEKEMVGHPSTKCHQMFAEKVAKKWFTA